MPHLCEYEKPNAALPQCRIAAHVLVFYENCAEW